MNVPKLRFKEFSRGEIKLFTIKDIANIQVGRDLIENSFSEIKTDKYCYPVYSNTIENRGLYGFYDFEEYDGNSLTVVGRGVGLGIAFSRNSGFGAIGRLLVISPKNNEFNVHYLAEFINFKLRIHNESGGIPQLPGSTFGNYTIVLPPLLEQTKIANFLIAIDEKISQLTQRCDFLKQYKKGVMQQIFSQKFRFKDDDGREFPEWEKKRLGEVCKPQQWTTISTSNLCETGFSVYGANGFIGYFNSYNHEHETVAVTCRGATCGEVNLIPAKSYITGNSMCLDDINQVFHNYKFIYYAMRFRGFRDVISGSAQPQIVGSTIRKVEFMLPKLAEQTKIANFLTAIDDKITQTQTQLEVVKLYKKGLLQQMFV